MAPYLIFEDEHLLVVNKPAGMNTHAPSPFSGEGMYEWLKNQEPRWGALAIIHRLDKETSGVMVLGKTPLANRSLTEQFSGRAVRKKYLLITDRPMRRLEFVVKSRLARAGSRYVSGAMGSEGAMAETRFVAAPGALQAAISGLQCGAPMMVEAYPLTGRTHQIRVHAAENGFPIVGDTLYGGTSGPRLLLHAAELTLKHPSTQEAMTFSVPAEWDKPPAQALRERLIDSKETDAYRLIHGASDGWRGWYVDRFGNYLLSQSEQRLSGAEKSELARLMEVTGAAGAYHKVLRAQVQKADPAVASPEHVLGESAPERFVIRENGLQYEVSFSEGYSAGLFLDQRENRRRLKVVKSSEECEVQNSGGSRGPLALPWMEVLNTFAYTCGFSVCAAKAGARTTSIDLSKKYLEWGRRNFVANGLDLEGHDFIYGDVFEWLQRLAKKGRAFDVIVIDPPTFSQSKESGAFRAEKDYGTLVREALPLLRAGGILFASSNAATWRPEKFLEAVERAFEKEGRRIVQKHYVPQPPDFPMSRAEGAYLKTVWTKSS